MRNNKIGSRIGNRTNDFFTEDQAKLKATTQALLSNSPFWTAFKIMSGIILAQTLWSILGLALFVGAIFTLFTVMVGK